MNYPRTNYEMTEDDLAAILRACKPTPVMMIGGTTSRSPQENANAAWSRLGEKMGFDYTTVQPAQGKGDRFFTAIPSETDEARSERLTREADEKKQAEISRIETEITNLGTKLAALKGCAP